MKVVQFLLLFLILGVGPRTAFAQNGTARADRLRFSGHDFIRLGDWAKDHHFDIHWIKWNESVQLTNHFARMTFSKDSKDVDMNGVRVRLCYPIVMRDGGAYIAELDVDETLTPVLVPPKNWQGWKIRKIVIDPGHGGTDPGFQDGSHQEKKYTLLLAQELCEQLKRAGYMASLTRTSDVTMDKLLRPDIARRRAADLFISVHWNSAGVPRSDVQGIETYCLTPSGAPSSNAGGDTSGAETRIGNRNNSKNMYFAYLVQRALVKSLSVEDRGVHRARFAVLCPAEMPAILIEGGFMSQPTESKKIYDAAYRQQMAKAIVLGVQNYKRQVEGEEGNSKVLHPNVK